MKNQWSQFPFVLRRKILLTFLAGIASIAVSLVIFTVAADRAKIAIPAPSARSFSTTLPEF